MSPISNLTDAQIELVKKYMVKEEEPYLKLVDLVDSGKCVPAAAFQVKKQMTFVGYGGLPYSVNLKEKSAAKQPYSLDLENDCPVSSVRIGSSVYPVYQGCGNLGCGELRDISWRGKVLVCLTDYVHVFANMKVLDQVSGRMVMTPPNSTNSVQVKLVFDGDWCRKSGVLFGWIFHPYSTRENYNLWLLVLSVRKDDNGGFKIRMLRPPFYNVHDTGMLCLGRDNAEQMNKEASMTDRMAFGMRVFMDGGVNTDLGPGDTPGNVAFNTTDITGKPIPVSEDKINSMTPCYNDIMLAVFRSILTEDFSARDMLDNILITQ